MYLLFKKQLKEKKSFLITDPSMTRFNLTLKECVDTVIWALKKTIGGEIIIRKSPSYKLIDVAKAISDKNKINIIGVRAGEKKHEELIPDTGNCHIYERDDYYIMIDKVLKENIKKIKKNYKFKDEIDSFSYNSKDNKKFLTKNELRELINFN